MFCPKCSHLQDSDQLRFCSRCGFSLEIVKELIEREVDDKAKSKSDEFPIQQKDISLGAGLMFVSGIVAVLWGFIISSAPIDIALSQTFFILGLALAFILLFFHPLVGGLHKLFSDVEKHSKHLLREQNGINLGAILMFIGTLKAILIANLIGTGNKGLTILLLMTGGFLMLLIVRWLVQTVYQLFLKGKTSDEDFISSGAISDKTLQLQDKSDEVALLPEQSILVDDYIPPRRKTRELIESSSVTEETTKSLSK